MPFVFNKLKSMMHIFPSGWEETRLPFECLYREPMPCYQPTLLFPRTGPVCSDGGQGDNLKIPLRLVGSFFLMGDLTFLLFLSSGV